MGIVGIFKDRVIRNIISTGHSITLQHKTEGHVIKIDVKQIYMTDYKGDFQWELKEGANVYAFLKRRWRIKTEDGLYENEHWDLKWWTDGSN